MNIVVYRAGQISEILPADESSKYSEKLMGEKLITVSCSVTAALDLRIGDYMTYNDENYYINTLPQAKKNGTNDFEYTIDFESQQYELGKRAFLLNGDSDFYLYGKADTFITQIVANMNRISSGWTVGTVDDTEYINLQFSSQNCLQVLNTLVGQFASQFSAEWWVNGKQINFTKAGTVRSLTFQYGKGKGLYNIERQTVNSANIITRLYAYGSTRNIPSTYRNGAKRLRFEVNGNSYLESNTDLYGVIEAVKNFDDIYPSRTGTVSNVSANDYTFVRDSGMPFDLNFWLLPEVKAKLHVETGLLAGYEFEIASYNRPNQNYIIIPYADSTGEIVPNANKYIAVGDKYKLLDMKMPDSYVTTAENTLLAKAQEYINANNSPRVSYTVTTDPIYFKNNGIVLNCCDSVTIIDTDLGINKQIRIIGLSRSLYNPYSYTFELADNQWQNMEVAQKLLNKTLTAKINASGVGDIFKIRQNQATETKVNKKTRNFTTQPTAPYEINDTWTDGTNQWVCIKSKYSGNFSTTDWAKATAYTDDTVALAAQATANAASATANEASSWAASASQNAATAMSEVTNIVSDNVLSPAEKPSQRQAWNVISAEKSGIDTQATNFGITTEKTSYDNAFQVLATYLNNGITYYSGVPAWIADASLANNTAIVGSTYRDNWQAFYNSRTTLLNAIAAKAKLVADNALATANGAGYQAYLANELAASKSRTFTAQPTTPYDLGDMWMDGNVTRRCITARASGNYTATDWLNIAIGESMKTAFEAGLITAGTMQVADTTTVIAGMTGAAKVNATSPVRFWAGDTFANRENAPFRIYENGNVYASNGEFVGKIIYTDSYECYVGLDRVRSDAGYHLVVSEAVNEKVYLFSTCLCRTSSKGKNVISFDSQYTKIYDEDGAVSLTAKDTLLYGAFGSIILPVVSGTLPTSPTEGMVVLQNYQGYRIRVYIGGAWRQIDLT